MRVDYFPRLFVPVAGWDDKLIKWVHDNFHPGDEVQFVQPSNWSKKILVLREKMVGRTNKDGGCAVGGTGPIFVWADDPKEMKKRMIKTIGIIDFYCHGYHAKESVDGDIKEGRTIMGIDWGDEIGVNAVQWLLAGIDGVANKTRMAKAIMKNGAVVPDGADGTELIELIKESNGLVKMVEGPEGLNIGHSAMLLIEAELLKLGTSLDFIPRRKGDTVVLDDA